jgi:acyl-CoA thioesterase
VRADTVFDRDLTLDATGEPGVLRGEFHDRWYIDRALHGGHVVAVMARAAETAVADPARHLRSLSVHYVAPAQPGPYEAHTVVDRTGRSLSNVRVQILQNGTVIASAMAALGTAWASVDWDHTAMPDVAGPDECPDLWDGTGGFTNLHQNYLYRRAIGGPIRSGERATRSGGWLRLKEPRPADAAMVANLADTWIPGPFTMFTEPFIFPTVDLTVQILRPLPLVDDDGSGFHLVVHSIDTALDGYVIQDTEVWSPSRVLVARARQHALLIPVTPRT